MADYDNDELGLGNSQHPANQPEKTSMSEIDFDMLTLQECLDYYKETRDIEPLENKVKEVSEGNKKSRKIIIQTIKALRKNGFNATANLLCMARDFITE